MYFQNKLLPFTNVCLENWGGTGTERFIKAGFIGGFQVAFSQVEPLHHSKLFLQPFLERGFNYCMSDLKILIEKNEENEVFASSKAAMESQID